VAYFCAEFALSEKIPTFAGGLGVLTGDLVKEAAQTKFPIVSVGLFYKEGYGNNKSDFSSGGDSPEKLGLKAVCGVNNEKILISVPVQDRMVFAQAWKWEEGENAVFLLDTNIDQNSGGDKGITDHLYVSNRETRIKQEMILGIGGFRLLLNLGIKPQIYHLNEGHCAFLLLSLIHSEMKRNKISFKEACEEVKKQVVFTNHTLVAAGQELFSQDLISAMINKYAEEIEIPLSDILSLASIENSDLFSMTQLALKLAGKINAVSGLHQKEASRLWPNYQIEKVTNGIRLKNWDRIENDSSKTLWKKHLDNKKILLSYIEKETGKKWDEKNLIFGWARRIVPYKRPLAILEDVERLKKLCNFEFPIKIVFAGKAHEDDPVGQKTVETLKEIINKELNENAVYLPNYDITVSPLITSGCDVWLNTPVVGFEACGTSTMKAALNGGLIVSTKDGWLEEINLNEIGWEIENVDITNSLLKKIEEEIVPLYYQHLANPQNSSWSIKMEKARKLIIEGYSAERVLREYKEKLYLPLLKNQGVVISASGTTL